MTKLTISERIELCQQCLEGVFLVAEEWASAAAAAKGLPVNSTIRAEDLLSGPAVVARQLQLTIQTLRQLQKRKNPILPGQVKKLPNGQVSVPVFPTRGFFDSLTFMGLQASVRMQRGVLESELHGELLDLVYNEEVNGVIAVLGAGNVSSIPATDSLNKIMFEGCQVRLKMNPVNEYLAPLFQRAFAPLVNKGFLSIFTGGAQVGSELIHADDVTHVHITGSAETHDSIVWGGDPTEVAKRKTDNSPVLQKPITSELGNVTPWIIVPGKFSRRQLRSQARHVAASITNNASFNCLATKVIVTSRKWHQRDEFLSFVQEQLSQTAPRPAYYPGSIQRYRRIMGDDKCLDDGGCLPWTLLVDQNPDQRPELFREESFVCVCAETALESDTSASFLDAAVEFVNERLTGTLCASVTIPDGFRKESMRTFERCLEQLRYGSVCINQWSGLAYGLCSPPWGAYPGATLRDVQSGIGNVHNTYLLAGHEKTVLHGPLINFPKPVWFSSHSNAVSVATNLLRLYHSPSAFRLPRLFAAALKG